MNNDYSVYKSRRHTLRETLREQGGKDGALVLFADTEGERHAFRHCGCVSFLVQLLFFYASKCV